MELILNLLWIAIVWAVIIAFIGFVICFLWWLVLIIFLIMLIYSFTA